MYIICDIELRFANNFVTVYIKFKLSSLSYKPGWKSSYNNYSKLTALANGLAALRRAMLRWLAVSENECCRDRGRALSTSRNLLCSDDILVFVIATTSGTLPSLAAAVVASASVWPFSEAYVWSSIE